MNDEVMITALVVIDAVMRELGHQNHQLSSVSDGEVILVGVVAALYFRNHQERALCDAGIALYHRPSEREPLQPALARLVGMADADHGAVDELVGNWRGV